MKCVIIVDGNLPRGLAANAAAALGLSLGAGRENLTGPEVRDGNGNVHAGITSINLPILEADAGRIKKIYEEALAAGESGLEVIGFSTLAQRCRSYDAYNTEIAKTPLRDLDYSGICLLGPAKVVNRIAGSLPTLK